MKHYIEIQSEVCKGCRLCIPECPKDVIEIGDSFNKKGWVYAVAAHNELCIGCKKCAIVCPDVAIRVFKED
jgi:2-oxoglutarate ferredoxin oxidoreductase subunit delta